jgi:glycosyltransferase involved in cell wall biosynthesis
VELPLGPSNKTGWPWTEGTGAFPGAGTLPSGRPWPRITIVTPSLNHGAFIEEAIRSVLLQAYPNLELIVVDGGSTDDSIKALGKYGAWLSHWICESDRGPASALNRGFQLGTGELLGFLNADDFLLPGCLATIAREFLSHPGADVVSGHGFFAKLSGEMGTPIFSDRWNLARFANDAGVLVQPATFFRRRAFEQVGGFKERTKASWDIELWADMALAGAVFHTVDEFLAAFRLHAASITGRHFRKHRFRDARAVREKMRGRCETPRDRLWSLVYRARKFSGHPLRTVNQRWFVYSALSRWSL